MIRKRFGLVLVLFFVYLRLQASACSCVAQSPKEKFEAAEYVFTAKILNLTDKPSIEKMMIEGKMTQVYGLGVLYAELKVEKVWKWNGPQATTVTVSTPNQGSACGIDDWEHGIRMKKINKDQTYLVYAFSGRKSGKKLLTTNLCVGTTLAQHAEADLKFLGPVKTP